MNDQPINRFGEPANQEDYYFAPDEELDFEDKEAWT